MVFIFFWYCWCKETIVVRMTNDLYLNGEKPSLNLKNNIELTFPLTFCIRFNLKGQLLHSFPIFMDKDTKFGLILRFTVGLGKVFLNEESLMFIIPQEYQIEPYSRHHLCADVWYRPSKKITFY